MPASRHAIAHNSGTLNGVDWIAVASCALKFVSIQRVTPWARSRSENAIGIIAPPSIAVSSPVSAIDPSVCGHQVFGFRTGRVSRFGISNAFSAWTEAHFGFRTVASALSQLQGAQPAGDRL